MSESRPPDFLPLGSRQGKLPLHLTAVQTIAEVYVVPAADPKVARHIALEGMACEVQVKHVRTMGPNLSEARARTSLTSNHHTSSQIHCAPATQGGSFVPALEGEGRASRRSQRRARPLFGRTAVLLPHRVLVVEDRFDHQSPDRE